MKQIVKKFKREDLPNEGLRLLSDEIGINPVKAARVKCRVMIVYFPKKVNETSQLNYIIKNPRKTPQQISEALGIGLRTAYRKMAAIK